MSSGSEIVTKSAMSTAHPTPPLAETPPREQQEDDDATSRTAPKARRRRDKPQLSCNLCRRHKSRCDRQQPCSRCAARGLTCTYAENHAAAWLPRPPAPTVPGVHDRLVQLERLVMSLSPGTGARGNNPAESLHSDPPIDGGSECGSMHVSASELRYVGGDHWAAILDSIADLKDHFDREEQLRLANSPTGDQIQDTTGGEDCSDPLTRPQLPHALLLYGSRRPASLSDILSALPPKGAVDRYISRYFNRLDLAPSAIHGPSFLREYDAFWANPSSVPVVWIGLLFSMMCLAVLASDASDSTYDNDVEQQSLQINLYREKIVQCLNVGEYTKSGPYVLETVVHYMYIEFSIRADADKDIWFLLALAVNIAMRMGFHRDPSHFKHISPLQGEMRRRLWVMILQGDILVSSQMGMPRMISDWQCDTAEPLNLNDADLDEVTSQLPPPRPETEITTALGVIARRRMLMVLGTISDLVAAVKPCSYAEIMRVDGVLNEAAASVPAPLKKPTATSITDSPQIIMARLFISHLFYKGQIMLHRRFLHVKSPTRFEDSFAYSRKACLDASLGMLEIQHILDEEMCPGGQLYVMRWRISSVMNHQFLTATMILCSLLHRGQTAHREEDITGALRRTRTIWIRSSSVSRDAKKAAETVSIVLARAGESRGYNEDVDGAMKGQGIPANPPSATNSSDAGADFGRQTILQGPMGFDNPDRFDIPTFSGIFTPPEQQGQNFTFNINTLERDHTLDDWMLMNGPPTGFQ